MIDAAKFILLWFISVELAFVVGYLYDIRAALIAAKRPSP